MSEIIPTNTLFFRGGLELLFEGHKELRIQEHPGWTLKELLDHLVSTHLKERPELFLKDKTMYSTLFTR